MIFSDNSTTCVSALKGDGLIFILSSPSGAGKTSLATRLLQEDSSLALSVSFTTRPPRAGEQEGKDYFFVSQEVFNAHIQKGTFLEYAEVFGHFYGTPYQPVKKFLSMGHDVLFDVDWQGTQQLSACSLGQIVRVFVLPPCFKELEKRLHLRAKDNHETIAYRMAKAQEEVRHWGEYDYIVINDHFEKAFLSLKAILQAERLKRTNQKKLPDFIEKLFTSHL